MPPTIQPQLAKLDNDTAPPVSFRIPDITKVWTLFYRHGVNPRCEKGFYHDGDMRSAVDRAKKHCELMGYRYIFIRPFVVDIEQEEIGRGRLPTS